MFPADQRFGATECAMFKIDLRLQVESELLLCDCGGKIMFHLDVFKQGSAVGIEEGVAIFAAFFRLVHGDIGCFLDGIGITAFDPFFVMIGGKFPVVFAGEIEIAFADEFVARSRN